MRPRHNLKNIREFTVFGELIVNHKPDAVVDI